MSTEAPVRGKELEPSPRTAWLFQGQGFQKEGMGKDLYQTSPAARRVYDIANRTLGISPLQLTQIELDQTINAQPAIVTDGLAWLAEKQARGEEGFTYPPIFVAGYSVGEITAFCAAGAIGIEEAIWLTSQRAKAMQDASEKVKGGLIMVSSCNNEIAGRLQEEYGLEVAIVVMENRLIFGGRLQNLEAAQNWLQSLKEVRTSRINVSGAFHTSLMEPAVESFAKALETIEIKDSQVPIIANSTGKPIQRNHEIRAESLAGLTQKLLWSKVTGALDQQKIDRVFEIPVIDGKNFLTSINKKVLGGIILGASALTLSGIAVWQRHHHERYQSEK